MLGGDVADYSEWKKAEELLGLVYSAGSTATKFGRVDCSAIIGVILGVFHYNELNYLPEEPFLQV
jgi:GPH family glycoside/pentoside/hexuronide:cation symporter